MSSNLLPESLNLVRLRSQKEAQPLWCWASPLLMFDVEQNEKGNLPKLFFPIFV